MSTHALVFGAATLAALVATPAIRCFVLARNLVEGLDPRKVHEAPVPRPGGIALLLALLAGLAPLALLPGGHMEGLGLLLGGAEEEARVLTVNLPVRDRRREGKVSVFIAFALNGHKLESVGSRFVYFGRLLDEQGLVDLPRERRKPTRVA